MAVCSEYLTYVTEALVLEDTVKNYERRDSTGWLEFLPFHLSYNMLISLSFIFTFKHLCCIDFQEIYLELQNKSKRENGESS